MCVYKKIYKCNKKLQITFIYIFAPIITNYKIIILDQIWFTYWLFVNLQFVENVLGHFPSLFIYEFHGVFIIYYYFSNILQFVFIFSD